MTRRRYRQGSRGFFLLAAVLLWVPVRGQSPVGAIEAELAKARSQKAAVGIKIVAAGSGRVIYESGAATPLAPASNMKVITTAAAMGVLGPDFQFTTPIGLRGQDLVVIGSGDPSTGDADLEGDLSLADEFDLLGRHLVKHGVGKIPGKLIVDASIFDDELRHPHWPKDQYRKWYAAPVAGLNINDNCLDVRAGPGEGGRGWLEIVPENRFVAAKPAFVAKGQTNTIIDAYWPGQGWELMVKVTLGSRPGGPAYVPIEQPVRFVGELLRERLAANGVGIDGPIELTSVRQGSGDPPEGFSNLIEHRSRRLSELVERTNKRSQNMFAECLFKRLGYEFSRKLAPFPVGSWNTGRLAIEEFLRGQADTDISGILLCDGSGLSKENRVTANVLVDVLKYAADQPWSQKYIDSLPVAGKDGTLRRRMRGGSAAGRVVAKTGYISGVSGLSGYILDREGRPSIAFSMLFNDFPRSQLWRIMQIQDTICVELVKYSDRMDLQ
ncbi:MAG: D-alanyl-D-alanine carboxypeptidase/D-alanyl-D-alanine-endopeptidase [Phycisphaerae bacterium]|nr:D-alanyl-D-alanine carboxypeptidase/D-alanyl-D-alanine-endopeptidase [Phycisphaerae bacterium]